MKKLIQGAYEPMVSVNPSSFVSIVGHGSTCVYLLVHRLHGFDYL